MASRREGREDFRRDDLLLGYRGSDLDRGAGAMVFWMGGIYLFFSYIKPKVGLCERDEASRSAGYEGFFTSGNSLCGRVIRDDSASKYLR